MLCFRLFSENNPAAPLADTVAQLREGQAPKDLYTVEPASLQLVPNAPFSYWAGSGLRRVFAEHEPFELTGARKLTKGAATTEDLRFVRAWWEAPLETAEGKWPLFSKGGFYSPIYSDVYLKLKWFREGAELKEFIDNKIGQPGQWSRWINAVVYYFRPGLTWPRRSQAGLSLRVLPQGCIFSDKGPSVFVEGDSRALLMTLLGISVSQPFIALIQMQMAFGSFEVGVLQRTPLPSLADESTATLTSTTRKAWSVKRGVDTSTLTSHAFHAPAFAPSRSTSKTYPP